MRDEKNIVTEIGIDIKVHEFVNKDTWQLHLTLHVNDMPLSMATASLGNTKYDTEAVVAAMQSLKNEYYEAIGSPMRYQNGKLVFLPADQGLIAKQSQNVGMKVQSFSCTEKVVA